MSTISQTIRTSSTPSAAFAALTTPTGIRGWWSRDSDVGEGQGANIVMRFDKDGRQVTMEFRIDAAEPDSRVQWTCTANGDPLWPGTTLTWTIAENDGGCTIEFAHAGFSESESPPYAMTVGGWQHFCGSLRAYLDDGAGQPW